MANRAAQARAGRVHSPLASRQSLNNSGNLNMIELIKSLRRGPGDHREVFAEFAVLMAFVVAEQLVSARHKPRLRVVK